MDFKELSELIEHYMYFDLEERKECREIIADLLKEFDENDLEYPDGYKDEEDEEDEKPCCHCGK